MSKTYEIINGQPQNNLNKMVTYDGLIDFLEMLKNEIPKMGTNNKIEASRDQSNYAFGNDNKILGVAATHNLLIGTENTTDGKNNFIFGVNNVAETSDATQYTQQNVYMFGRNLLFTGEKDESAPIYFFGQYNEDTDYGSYAIIIGGGSATKPKNLLTLGYDGGITIDNGHLSSRFTFNNFVTFNSSLYLESTTTKILDNGYLGGQNDPVYLEGALRPTFQPWKQNQMLWLVNKGDAITDTLQINYQSQDAIDEAFSDPDRQWKIPKGIAFRAGGESWANLYCGNLIANGIISASTIQVPVYTGKEARKTQTSGQKILETINFTNGVTKIGYYEIEYSVHFEYPWNESTGDNGMSQTVSESFDLWYTGGKYIKKSAGDDLNMKNIYINLEITTNGFTIEGSIPSLYTATSDYPITLQYKITPIFVLGYTGNGGSL